jgi:hypothetical protein
VRGYVAQHFLDGQPAPEVIPFAYPPTALPLLLVHAIGTPRQGYALSMFVYGLAFACTLLLAARRLGASAGEASAIVIAAGASGIVYLNALLGQTGPLIGALALAWLAFARDRPAAAGLALGLTLIKPQYSAFLWLAAAFERRPRVLGFAALSGAAWVALVTLLFGVERWAQWLAAARRPNPTLPFMANWLGPFSRLQLASTATLQSAALVLMFGAWVLAALWLWSTRARAHSEQELRARSAFLIALATLVSPNTHPYDLTLWFAVALLLPWQRWLAVLALALLGWVGLPFALRPLFALVSFALALAALRFARRT